MADGRDLHSALEESLLRLGPVEEQIILNEFSVIEKRLHSFFCANDGKGEVREPYEFN